MFGQNGEISSTRIVRALTHPRHRPPKQDNLEDRLGRDFDT